MDANHTLDARRTAKQDHLPDATQAAVSLAQPVIEFQTNFLRLWADSCLVMAQALEQSIQKLNPAAKN